MDMLVESRLTFRQGLTVLPFAVVSGKQVGRYILAWNYFRNDSVFGLFYSATFTACQWYVFPNLSLVTAGHCAK